MSGRRWFRLGGLVLILLGLPLPAGATEDPHRFDDTPLKEPLRHPDWFKESFMDLGDDLAEAVAAGKKGIIVYFGQRRCAYCRMLLQVNWRLPDIVAYTRKHFDVIPVDIWSPEEVTDVQGRTLTQRQFALREKTNFTPSLIFYDAQGREALRLRGYYPPYRFRAALEYVVDGYYLKETFADYLARGENAPKFDPDDLNEEDFFAPPPYQLDRSRLPGERPLVVFFEQGECHACDILHGEVLRDPEIHRLFARFDNVQLDLWSDTPVVTPDGRHTTARAWAHDLGLFYAPSLLFFDEHGREIIRVDSVVRFYRLRNVLKYIATRAWLTQPDYQRWRVSH